MKVAAVEVRLQLVVVPAAACRWDRPYRGCVYSLGAAGFPALPLASLGRCPRHAQGTHSKGVRVCATSVTSYMLQAADGNYSWHATQRSDDDAPSKLAALMQRVFDDHAARKPVGPTRPPQASIGPTLPPPGVIGPAGPPPGSVASSSSPSPSDVIGPAMPPPNRAEVMGPPPRPATTPVAGAGAGAGDGAGAGAGAGAGDESSDDDVGPVVALDPRARAGAAVGSRKLRRIRRCVGVWRGRWVGLGWVPARQ